MRPERTNVPLSANEGGIVQSCVKSSIRGIHTLAVRSKNGGLGSTLGRDMGQPATIVPGDATRASGAFQRLPGSRCVNQTARVSDIAPEPFDARGVSASAAAPEN